MPVGIPGMGKSTFIETQLRPYFESQPGVNFVTFASDAIRKEVLDDTLAKNKSQGINKTRDQVFIDTGKRASNLFMQTLD
jgi:adenylate kinase